MELNDDGSMVGKTFSGDKYTGPFPSPKYGGRETLRDYRARVDEAVAQGFHLGDLGNESWTLYCMGSGSFEGVDSNSLIE